LALRSQPGATPVGCAEFREAFRTRLPFKSVRNFFAGHRAFRRRTVSACEVTLASAAQYVMGGCYLGGPPMDKPPETRRPGALLIFEAWFPGKPEATRPLTRAPIPAPPIAPAIIPESGTRPIIAHDGQYEEIPSLPSSTQRSAGTTPVARLPSSACVGGR